MLADVYRNSISSRFTLCEWDQNNRVNYCVARTEMDVSERMRTDAWRAVRMTEQRTRMRQNNNTRKLSALRYFSGTCSLLTTDCFSSLSLYSINPPHANIWTQKRVPNGYERCFERCSCCCCWGSCCYQIFHFLRLCRFSSDRNETFHRY